MSSAAATKKLADAKAKRQKQILAVGSVILLALLGFELPKMLGGNAGQSTAPPIVTDVTGVPGSGSPLAAASGTLPDTDRVVIEPGSGQLISFGLFKSKDPFVQQLSALSPALPSTEPTPATANPAGTPATLPATPAQPQTTPAQPQATPRRTAPNGGLTPVTTTAATTLAPVVPFPSTTSAAIPVVPTSAPTTPASTAPAPTPAPAAAPAVAPSAVAISTNGLCENLGVNGTFPGTEDIFRVISIAKDGKSVKIAVVGGAYDSGQSTVTLKQGEKLTLVNTADGTRYVLLLKAKCDVETLPASGSSTTTGTATVAAPTTIATPATPIVTDALDTTTPTG